MDDKRKIIIDYSICDPSKCNFECISKCPVNRRNNENIGISVVNERPVVDLDGCSGCGVCIASCPLNAISSSKNGDPLTINKPVDLKLWKTVPYLVDEDIYQQFSEEDIIFSRAGNDPHFSQYRKNPHTYKEDRVNSGDPGFSEHDYVLAGSAWAVYSGFEKAHSREPMYKKADKKYEEDNPKKLSKIVKQAAKANGAALVGITELNRMWLYSKDRRGTPIDIPDNINNVIVMAVEMDLEAIQSSPSQMSSFASGNGYSRMAFLQATVSEFIRGLGYDAIPAGNNTAPSLPLAIDAGLGQYGRHGLLITEKYGSNVRLCKIFTDMPLVADKPIDFGVLEFCRTCMKCADTCPSNSISKDKDPTWFGPTRSNNPGIFKWYVNVETCYTFWVQNASECSNCIAYCPFTKNLHWSHKIARFFIKHFPIFNRLWVKIDDWMGYGKQNYPEDFWEDNHRFIHLK
jgi:reductive dehalogenase